MAPIKNVIVVGAGGQIGAPISAALADAGFNVTALSRKSSKSILPYKTISVSDDYLHEELVAAFKGQDAVVSALNSFIEGVQEKFIDAAIEAGVRRFIPSEFGGDTTNVKSAALVPFFQLKFATAKYLRSKQDQIEWTSIATGNFYDWGLAHNFFGFDIKAGTATLVDSGANKFSSSTLAQVGAWVATVLTHADRTANVFAPVESFEISQLDMLAALEKATGKKFAVTYENRDDIIAGARAGVEAGNAFAQYGLLRAVVFGEFDDGDYGASHHAQAVAIMAELGVEPADLQIETEKAVKAMLG